MFFGQTRPMEVYDRQIKYLDYLENGLRIRGAGFVKLERQDNLCSISLQVSGLYRKDRFTRPLLLLDEQGERELCRLQLADGGIKLYLEGLDCANLDGQGLQYEQLRGLRIPVSEGKEVRCILERRRIAEPVRVEREAAEQSSAEQSKAEQSRAEQSRAEQSWVQQEMQTLEPMAIEKQEPESARTAAFKDDKWEQLWTIYPHKCPFADDREYLAVGPGDFVILSERNYKLVNNSFLLHGYYNYHHLILTRIRERNRMSYYIGVPGNFLEREKRTAIMFGFKSFECAVEPAQEGDFGYYMIPVEL